MKFLDFAESVTQLGDSNFSKSAYFDLSSKLTKRRYSSKVIFLNSHNAPNFWIFSGIAFRGSSSWYHTWETCVSKLTSSSIGVTRWTSASISLVKSNVFAMELPSIFEFNFTINCTNSSSELMSNRAANSLKRSSMYIALLSKSPRWAGSDAFSWVKAS